MKNIFKNKSSKEDEKSKWIHNVNALIRVPGALTLFVNKYMEAHPEKKLTWFLEKWLTLKFIFSRTKKYKNN